MTPETARPRALDRVGNLRSAFAAGDALRAAETLLLARSEEGFEDLLRYALARDPKVLSSTRLAPHVHWTHRGEVTQVRVRAVGHAWACHLGSVCVVNGSRCTDLLYNADRQLRDRALRRSCAYVAEEHPEAAAAVLGFLDSDRSAAAKAAWLPTRRRRLFPTRALQWLHTTALLDDGDTLSVFGCRRLPGEFYDVAGHGPDRDRDPELRNVYAEQVYTELTAEVLDLLELPGGCL